MNIRQAQRAVAIALDIPELVNWRKLKRAENILIEKPGLYEAHCRGSHDFYRKPRHNPYPPGKRHNQWQQAYGS